MSFEDLRNAPVDDCLYRSRTSVEDNNNSSSAARLIPLLSTTPKSVPFVVVDNTVDLCQPLPNDDSNVKHHVPARSLPFLEDQNYFSPRRDRRQRWAKFGFLWIALSMIALIGVFVYLKISLPDWHLVDSDSCDLDPSSALQVAFQINIRAIRGLTFGAAKSISVATDFVLGQLFRLLLGWLSWRILSDAAAAMMEVSSVSYDVSVFYPLGPV
jgi:hypothetical protein